MRPGSETTHRRERLIDGNEDGCGREVEDEIVACKCGEEIQSQIQNLADVMKNARNRCQMMPKSNYV